MNTLLAAVAAGTLVTGLIYMFLGLRPAPAPLDSLVTELHRPRTTSPAANNDVSRILSTLSFTTGRVRRQDIDVCAMSDAKWLSQRLTWAMLGAAPGFVACLMTSLGLWAATPLWMAALAVPAGVVVGWFYALIDLRSDAGEARKKIRHAVASYLELVTILMAGGAGPESAMFDAADVGEGLALHHFRSALASARVRREDPWIGLGRVGRQLDIRELIELEATMRLAASGAKVKSSLITKSEAIRERALAQIESEAEAKSETMALPVVLMFAGFMLLLGYPAVSGLSMT